MMPPPGAPPQGGFDPGNPFPPGSLQQHVNGPPPQVPPPGMPAPGAAAPVTPISLLTRAAALLVPMAQQNPAIAQWVADVKTMIEGGAGGGMPPGAGAPPMAPPPVPAGPPPGAMPPRPM